MKGKITGEDEVRIGLHVTDNNSAKHRIEMEFDGEIKYHQCQSYDKKARNRTDEENEHNKQARKFAQFYVSTERGYDTVPPHFDPNRIEAVRRNLASLSDTEFRRLFGDLRQQMASYHDDTERAIPIPEAAPGPDSVLYRQNVYLGFDPRETEVDDQAQELAATHGLDLAEISERRVADISSEAVSDWKAFATELADQIRGTDVECSDALSIDAVSSLYTTYIADDQYITAPETDPFDRDPDTMIELPPVDPGSLDEFRAYLDHHLKCQIRDSFVRMGLQPPEPFRVLGNGRLEATAAYKLLEMYPEYHDPNEDQLLKRA